MFECQMLRALLWLYRCCHMAVISSFYEAVFSLRKLQMSASITICILIKVVFYKMDSA